jgi:hypothetical protein
MRMTTRFYDGAKVARCNPRFGAMATRARVASEDGTVTVPGNEHGGGSSVQDCATIRHSKGACSAMVGECVIAVPYALGGAARA